MLKSTSVGKFVLKDPPVDLVSRIAGTQIVHTVTEQSLHFETSSHLLNDLTM
jgi:hypothetical protein